MIVLSLVLVIAAAVSLFIGLFVATTDLTFIFAAIVLCLLSLLLLWLGTRAQRKEQPSAPSAPVYGGPARAGVTATRGTPTVRSGAGAEADDEDLDDLTAPPGGEVVRATTARDRAEARVASAPPSDVEPVVADDQGAAATASPARKSAAKKSTAKKSTAKKSTAKKSTAKKSTAKKSTAKKSTAKKSTAGASTGRRTTGAAARARLTEIPGVGPAKQDALLARYGSLEAIRDAPVEDIVDNVRGFGNELADRVKKALS